MSDDLTIAYQLGVEDMRSRLHKQADEIERLRAENEKLREAFEQAANDMRPMLRSMISRNEAAEIVKRAAAAAIRESE